MNRSHSRPVGATSPAAESAARVAGAIQGLLAAPGITVADVGRVLAAKPIDVVRWRRGGGVPSYRRAEVEDRLARTRVVVDPDTGKNALALGAAGGPDV